MIRAVDMGSTFALARYAAEKAKSLVDQIPGGSLNINVYLDDKWRMCPWSVAIDVHRVIKPEEGADFLAPMPFSRSHVESTADVEEAIKALRGIVTGQSWQLHESEKADSEMDAA